MDKFEKELKEKYEKIVVPDRYFDTTRVFERYEYEQRRKKQILKAASIVTIILIAGITIISGFVFKNNTNDTENVDLIGENVQSEEIQIVGKLTVRMPGEDYRFFNEKYLSLIKVNKIISYEIIDGVPYTRIKAQVLKNYIEDLDEEVEVLVPGGVFKVEELKNKVEDFDISIIENYSDEEYLNVTCYNDIYIPIAEVGKTYLTSVEIDKGIYRVDASKKFAFKEYDISSNTIKDMNGNSEVVDIERYLKSIDIEY